MMDKSIGYLVDQSHAPLVFAAVQGLAEVLEHGLGRLDTSGTDVSPIIVETRQRLVVITLYEPDPMTIQVVQHDGQLERLTEIIGAGIGMGVLREVRRTLRALEVELGPLSRQFKNRIAKEKTTFIKTCSLLKADSLGIHSSLSGVLRRLQDTYRRESGHHEVPQQPGGRSNPSFHLRHTSPKAIRELEHAVDEILSGSWDRAVLEYVAEVAWALAEAFRAEGLGEAAGVARSLSCLVSVSPEELRSVEHHFRKKLVELLSTLKGKAVDALGDTGS